MERHLNNAVYFDAKRELIKIEAEGIAQRHGLDLKRIISIYERCPDFGWIAPVLDPFETNLDRAIAIMGKEKALELFENEDLCKLAERVSLVDDINLSNDIPLYSLDELASVTEDFIQYLLNNRRHLLNTGYPGAGFNQSPWLDKQLSNLYHFKFPKDIERPPRGDRTRLKTARDMLFGLKVKVLKKLLQCVISPKLSTPWDKCLPLLTESISAEESEFYLQMDRFYMGDDIRGKWSAEEIPGLNRPGGLTDLLEIIGHFDKELAIGTFTHTRDGLGILLKLDEMNRPRLIVRNYFEALDHPLRNDLDSALHLFSCLQASDKDFWENYRTRVIHALENDFRGEVVGEKVKRELVQLIKPQLRTFSRLVKSFREAIGKLPQIPFSEVKNSKTPEQFVFRRKGHFWTVIYEGKECPPLENVKGMRYIAHLLEHPNEDIPVRDLIDLFGKKVNYNPAKKEYEKKSKNELSKEHISISRGSDAGPKIDKKAIAEYKRRYKDLQEELEEAERNNDIQRKDDITHEMEKITEQLTSGLGRGGSLRKDADSNERDRRSVGNCIARSLKKIGEVDSNLWRHLRIIDTGKFCSYRPETPIPWEISYHS